MPYLVAAVVVLTALVALDLVLTFGVIRRLREHTKLLSERSGGMSATVIPAGETPAEFAAADTDGAPVGSGTLDGTALFGFFSTGCGACREQMPKFIAAATEFPGGRNAVLGVVTGPEEETAFYVDQLTPVARVVLEGPEGNVTKAFRVEAFPTWVMLGPDGVVTDGGIGLDKLPQPAAV